MKRTAVLAAVAARRARWKIPRSPRWRTDRIDVTVPGTRPRGHIHLASSHPRDLRDFERGGFVRGRHPEIDWDWYALNRSICRQTIGARRAGTFFIDAPNDRSWAACCSRRTPPRATSVKWKKAACRCG